MSDGAPTATIKFGKGYDDPWLVFSGSIPSIRTQILEAFDIKDDTNQTLASLVAQASAMAQGLWKVLKSGSEGLGGAAISVASETPSKASTGTSSASQQESTSDPNAGILEAIDKATSVTELQALYAKHSAAFKASKEIQAKFREKRATFN